MTEGGGDASRRHSGVVQMCHTASRAGGGAAPEALLPRLGTSGAVTGDILNAVVAVETAASAATKVKVKLLPGSGSVSP